MATVDSITVSLEDVVGPALDELQALRIKAASYDRIAPDLEQLRALAAAGFLGAAGPESALILAAVSEIMLLRQERIPPVFMADLSSASISAFGTMWRRLGELLNDRSKGSHQARYEAFLAGINYLMPSVVGNARTIAFDDVRTLLNGMERNARERIDVLAGTIQIPERGRSIAVAEAERKAYADALDALNSLAHGGLAPTLTANGNSSQNVH